MVTPPQDTELEQALLGAVLHGYRDLPGLRRVVSGEDFYRPAHELIWDAMLAVHRDGLPVNPHTVRSALGEAIGKVGGAREPPPEPQPRSSAEWG